LLQKWKHSSKLTLVGIIKPFFSNRILLYDTNKGMMEHKIFWLTQILSGHGSFMSYLTKFSPATIAAAHNVTLRKPRSTQFILAHNSTATGKEF